MHKVYKHTFPNGKIYIGITLQKPEDRWINGKGYHHNSYMINAINKYGWENIKHEILFDNLTKEQAIEKEIELIAFYRSNKRDFGYNIESGGNYAGCVSEETKKKISNSCKGKTMPREAVERIAEKNRGKKRSPEVCAKLSQQRMGKKRGKRSYEHNENMRKALTGKKRTLEQRQRMSEAQKGKKMSEEARKKIGLAHKGKKVSEETRRKMSEVKKGKTASPETREKMRKRMQKKVRCIETGEIFNSVLEATAYYGFKSHRSICASAQNPCVRAGGKHWEYINEKK